jgi:hypothetical protein
VKVTLGERIKSFGMFPDIGKIQGEMNVKFDQLLAKLDEILQELRKQNAGQALLFIVCIVVLLALVGLFAVCTPGENDQGLGRIQLVSHDYDGDCDWEGSCGGYDERNGGYGDNRGGDGRFGGGRSGDYDGGPGDDCRTACNNTIIVPSPGGGRGERGQAWIVGGSGRAFTSRVTRAGNGSGGGTTMAMAQRTSMDILSTPIALPTSCGTARIPVNSTSCITATTQLASARTTSSSVLGRTTAETWLRKAEALSSGRGFTTIRGRPTVSEVTSSMRRTLISIPEGIETVRRVVTSACGNGQRCIPIESNRLTPATGSAVGSEPRAEEPPNLRCMIPLPVVPHCDPKPKEI